MINIKIIIAIISGSNITIDRYVARYHQSPDGVTCCWYSSSADFFSRPKTRLFFETKYFRDRYRDFFSRLNIFETDTETFFRDQNFRDRDRYSQKIEKSLDTEKSRDEMSHSGDYYGYHYDSQLCITIQCLPWKKYFDNKLAQNSNSPPRLRHQRRKELRFQSV